MKGDFLPKKIINEKKITIAEAREILEKVSEEDLGEFQRRVFEYTKKFPSLTGTDVKKLVKKLTEAHKLNINEAIQIINCMPESVEEIRSILAIKGRTFQIETFKDILKDLNEFRKK